MLVTMAMHESLHSTSPCQNKNINVSRSLNSYITHPTGAGPRGLLPHMDGPQDWALNQSPHETFANNIAYHSYYQTRKGHCDCFTITILQKKGLLTISTSHGWWISLPPSATTAATHPSLTSSSPPPPD